MDHPKTIVALVGPLGAGKDTVAGHLVEHHGFRRLAFADEIKRQYYAASGHSEDEFKAARGTPLEEAIRSGLWRYSDCAKRENGPLCFVNAVVDAVRDCQQPVVVTDVRTREELGAMRSIGAMVVLVVRVGRDAPLPEPERHQPIAGSRLSYGEVEEHGDKLFINCECVDPEFRSCVIEVFCRHAGILGEATAEVVDGHARVRRVQGVASGAESGGLLVQVTSRPDVAG